MQKTIFSCDINYLASDILQTNLWIFTELESHAKKVKCVPTKHISEM